MDNYPTLALDQPNNVDADLVATVVAALTSGDSVGIGLGVGGSGNGKMHCSLPGCHTLPI